MKTYQNVVFLDGLLIDNFEGFEVLAAMETNLMVENFLVTKDLFLTVLIL